MSNTTMDHMQMIQMDAHLSERPKVVFPSYPGFPTYRMRTKIDKYRTVHAAELCDPEMQEVAETLLQNMIQTWWREECEHAYADGILKQIKEEAYRSASSNVRPKTDTFFVTINPDPSTSLETLTTTVGKYVDMKFVESAEYVFEQRGSTVEDAGKGAHVHMLVKTKTNVADFKKRTHAKFSKLVGHEKHVDIRPVLPQHVDDKREYMRGYKTGEGKSEKVLIDVIWREKYNLQPYYTRHNAHYTETPLTHACTESVESSRSHEATQPVS